jgi:hypothetical protein
LAETSAETATSGWISPKNTKADRILRESSKAVKFHWKTTNQSKTTAKHQGRLDITTKHPGQLDLNNKQ